MAVIGRNMAQQCMLDSSCSAGPSEIEDRQHGNSDSDLEEPQPHCGSDASCGGERAWTLCGIPLLVARRSSSSSSFLGSRRAIVGRQRHGENNLDWPREGQVSDTSLEQYDMWTCLVNALGAVFDWRNWCLSECLAEGDQCSPFEGRGRRRTGGGTTAAEEPAEGQLRVILGRYAYRKRDVMGKGGFSVVYRGVDLQTSRNVAIKTYSGLHPWGGSGGEKTSLFRQYTSEVRILSMLQRLIASVGSSDCSHGACELRSNNAFFVELIDFSRIGDERFIEERGVAAQLSCDVGRTARATSGPQDRPSFAADGRCYLVLEAACETLEDFLSGLRAPLCRVDVQRIFREMCEAVAALHFCGFVHLDVKPANLMRFPCGHHKLIDMDGILAAGGRVRLSEVICTSMYCSPELARAFVADDETPCGATFRVSPSSDVFSLGLVGVELASLRQPLEGRWDELSRIDDNSFYKFLSDPSLEVQLPPEVSRVSREFHHLLGRMLEPAQGARICMQEVLAHPFFDEWLSRVP